VVNGFTELLSKKKTLIIYRRVKKLHNQVNQLNIQSLPSSWGKAHDRTCMANANNVGAWSTPTESKTNIFLEHAGELGVSLH